MAAPIMKSLVNQWHHSSSYLATASVGLSTATVPRGNCEIMMQVLTWVGVNGRITLLKVKCVEILTFRQSTNMMCQLKIVGERQILPNYMYWLERYEAMWNREVVNESVGAELPYCETAFYGTLIKKCCVCGVSAPIPFGKTESKTS